MDRQGFPQSEREQKRSITSVMQRVAKQLGNTPAVTRESYVSPAVVEQYLAGRTIDDFRPRHLRVVKARNAALLPEEQAMLSLLRSWLSGAHETPHSCTRVSIRFPRKSPHAKEENGGSENGARVRQLWQRGRRRKGCGDARHVHRRAPRGEAGRPLRPVRRQDAGPRRRPPRPPTQVSHSLKRHGATAASTRTRQRAGG